MLFVQRVIIDAEDLAKKKYILSSFKSMRGPLKYSLNL
jgi:hypothetical protein